MCAALAACSPGGSSNNASSSDAFSDSLAHDASANGQRTERAVGESALGRIHRMNNTEYHNTLRDLLDPPVDLIGLFPAENVAHGFSNNSEAQNITDMVVERYLEAAEKVSAAVLAEDTLSTRAEIEEMGFKEVSSLEEPKAGEGSPKTFTGEDGATVWCGGLSHSMDLDFSVESSGTYRLTLPLWWENLAGGLNLDPDKSPVIARIDGTKVSTWESSNLSLSSTDLLIYTAFHTMDEGPHTLELSLAPQVLSEVEGGRYCVDYLETSGPVDTPIEIKSGDGSVLAACDHTIDGVETCAEMVIAAVGRRAWRRALEPKEVDDLVIIVTDAMDNGWLFRESLTLALQGILLHPNFIFLIEDSRASGKADSAHITPHEMASRLSYFLWSSTPDETLLECAEEAGLDVGVANDPSACSVENQISRMLDDEKAHAIVDDFMVQWFMLGGLETLTRDPDKFPDFTPGLALSMKEESLRFLEEIYNEGLGILDIYDAPFSWINEELRGLYGLPGGSGDSFERVDFSGTERGGFLKQAAFLNLSSTASRTSPVQRGVFILDRILCSPPPAPPDNIPALVEKDLNSKSVQELMAQHRADPACSGCHALIDPLGIVFENYDATGVWRDEDSGGPINSSASLITGEEFGSVDDLVAYLRDNPDLIECAVERMFTWAMGRGVATEDAPYLEDLIENIGNDPISLKKLARAIVLSEPFLMRRAQTEEP